MAKRMKNGGGNTLFNYFSPTSKSSNNENSISKANLRVEDQTPKKSQEKRPAAVDSDNDEPIQATKRRRRIIQEDSSDNESNDEQMETEEKQETKREQTRNKLANLPKISSENRPQKPAALPVEETSTVWLHEKLEFLQPNKIRDLDRRRPGDSDYNPRTLYVPQEFLVKQTPAMRQWWEIKSKHYDCVLFFKVGKFYELYHMDAVTGVNELALSFMKGEFAHSGFPEIAYGRFSNSLVDLGYKVARVEQTETPDMLAARLAAPGTPRTKSDKVVRRELCQVSSRATRVCGIQDANTLSSQSDHLCAILESVDGQQREFGICFVDTAVGVFRLGQFNDDQHCSRLLTLFSEYPPAAILEERGNLQPDTKSLLKTSLGNVKFETLSSQKEFYGAQKTVEVMESAPYYKKEGADSVNWPEALKEMVFDNGVKCNEGKTEFSLALRCLGAIHFYLKTCQLDIQLFSLGQVEKYETASNSRYQQHMVLDAGALHNLHILGANHSLQAALDRCGSAGGKRLLRQWICRPLCNINNIKLRQKAVTELTNQPEVLRELSTLLSQLPDLEREVAKIHTLGNYVRSRTHPDSRAILYEEDKYSKRKINDFMAALQAFQTCSTIMRKCESLESDLLVKFTQHPPNGVFPDVTDTLNYFNQAFDHAEAKKLGKIMPRPGVDEDYDRTIEKLEELKHAGEEYLREQGKFFNCKVNFFGRDKKRFQLEVPEKAASKSVNDSYQLEGTKKGSNPCKRYSTATTRKLLADTLATEKENREIVHDLNRKIFEKFSSNYDMWMSVCECISTLDCLMSLAQYATSQSVEMCVPEISDDKQSMYEVEEGVHPFIPHVEDFIPNSLQLGCAEGRPPLMIITGANMGGKTTLMRQTALHAIMAQMGSWVPARSLRLSLVDRVFTRLGARDDIMAGRSTFHVELREALSVLQHATPRSLVLLDELGRGTSTHDGSAIAAAYVRDLSSLQCRAVFSTHYHGVMSRFVRDPLVQVCHMACRVEAGTIEDENEAAPETVTFLYKIKDGACPRSYGFNAARLAGLPSNIIQRGQKVSKAVETDTLCRKLFVQLFKSQDDITSVLKTLRSLQI